MAALSSIGWDQCIDCYFAQGHALRAPHIQYENSQHDIIITNYKGQLKLGFLI